MKLPPFGRELSERQRFKNLPFLVIVTAGLYAWPRARRWNQSLNDTCGLVFPGGNPSAYKWPVSGCACVVEWDTGPNPAQVTGLIRELIQSNAASVTSKPVFVDPRVPGYHYDTTRPLGERWIQAREQIKTVRGTDLKEMRRVG